MASRPPKKQFACVEANSGALMGYPNSVFDNSDAARAVLVWHQQEFERKRREFEADPDDPTKQEAWSRVAGHRYVVRVREVTSWRDLDE